MVARVLIAGTHSSVGKTTVTLGLLAALRRRGLRPAPFKVGPDYIDPSLHTQAAGRVSRNLDQWLLDDATLRAVFRRGTNDVDVAVIEGVMGLFDGIGSTQQGSTAAVARALDCPVVLVLDVAAMSGTAAALALGCQQLEPSVQLVGVLLNRVGSDAHASATAEAIQSATGLPVLGSLPADAGVSLPERHLGLIPAGEGGAPHHVIDALADLVEHRFDLDALLHVCCCAPELNDEPSIAPIVPAHTHVGIAVAQDRAFGFYYQDAIDVLAECGADILPFSPLADSCLPTGTDGVYLGGGFPEHFVEELAANTAMRDALHAHAAAGRPIYAECGGLMALGRSITTFDGRTLPVFDLLPVDSCMQPQPVIGYCEVEALRDLPIVAAGDRIRGHEFHWSTLVTPPRQERAAYRVVGQNRNEGVHVGNTVASYVHLNFAGAPHVPRRFIASCAASARTPLAPPAAVQGLPRM